MKKAIVSTSTSCMDYLIKPSNVFTLPMNIHMNGVDYLDGKNITISQLSQHMLNDSHLKLSTSAPDEGQLIEFFYELIDKGIEEVLVITLSSHLGLAYNNLRAIRSIFGEKLKIHLFDSRSISHGETVLVYEAAKMLAEDKDIAQIILRLNKLRDATTMYFTIDNLKTMIKTKRVSGPAGFFASIFGIKPIVTVNDEGQVFALEKVRGLDKSLYRLAELITQNAHNKTGQIYTMANKDNPYLDELHQILAGFGYRHITNFPVASVSVANIGPHAIGAVFVEDI